MRTEFDIFLTKMMINMPRRPRFVFPTLMKSQKWCRQSLLQTMLIFTYNSRSKMDENTGENIIFSKNTTKFPHHFVPAAQKHLHFPTRNPHEIHLKWTWGWWNCAKRTYGKRGDGMIIPSIHVWNHRHQSSTENVRMAEATSVSPGLSIALSDLLEPRDFHWPMNPGVDVWWWALQSESCAIHIHSN